MNPPKLQLLHTRNLPIYLQLQIEEALIRLHTQNWWFINEGSPPAIVLGISNSPHEWVHLEKAAQRGIPLIRRFSGGGTVVVDSQTLFMTWMGARSLLPCPPFPRPLMEWISQFFTPLLPEKMALRENDLVMGEKKFGGNAQYLPKERWLHHCSLLWDFQPENMELLPLPNRRPNYRHSRSHTAFVTPLKNHFPSKKGFIERVKKEVEKFFILEKRELEEVLPLLNQPHRKSTTLLEAASLLERGKREPKGTLELCVKGE